MFPPPHISGTAEGLSEEKASESRLEVSAARAAHATDAKRPPFPPQRLRSLGCFNAILHPPPAPCSVLRVLILPKSPSRDCLGGQAGRRATRREAPPRVTLAQERQIALQKTCQQTKPFRHGTRK
ncbi:Hypothetical predicted protein [Podarcis lilfordi]|uniref:Uncharacterized protein n=1 Tax=Podarcis lilfordi TaxID=74358 RepID=A0AA35P2K8_9SAUR|nr:Hypothetical predicted protein [Podarcis lilfordi]